MIHEFLDFDGWYNVLVRVNGQLSSDIKITQTKPWAVTSDQLL